MPEIKNPPRPVTKEDTDEIYDLLFGESWEPESMMGKLLTEHFDVDSGDISWDQQILIDSMQKGFAEQVRIFLEVNQACFKNASKPYDEFIYKCLEHGEVRYRAYGLGHPGWPECPSCTITPEFVDRTRVKSESEPPS